MARHGARGIICSVTSSSTRWLLLWLIALGSAASLLSLIDIGLQINVGHPGTIDFVQYWAAFQLLTEGRNPYEAEAMHAIQLTVGQSTALTTLMWNPPWTPILLAPLLFLPFPSAVVLWFIFSILCLSFIALALPRALGQPAPPLLVRALAVSAFLPVVDNLAFGQIALPLTAALVGTLSLIATKRYFLAGLTATVLTIKPHLLLLLIIPLLISLKEAPRQIGGRALLGFLVGGGTLLGVMLLIASDALQWWLNAFISSPTSPGATSTAEWKTAALVTVVRELIAEPGQIPPRWPFLVVPGCALLLSGFLFLRGSRTLQLTKLLPPLLCLSLMFAPYAWLYDQSLLVICQLDITTRWWWKRGNRNLDLAMRGLVLVQLAAFTQPLIFSGSQDSFFWLPCAMLALWSISVLGDSLLPTARPISR